MPPIKLQSRGASRNRNRLHKSDQALVKNVGGAISIAASQRRSIDTDPRDAARRAAVEIATAALHANNAETAAHSDDVDLITEALARKLGLSGQRLQDVIAPARLHDTAKLGAPSQILNKPAPLTYAEP